MVMMKPILDVCCGSKMFYFDKNDSRVAFCDIREENHILCDGRSLQIKPDIISDFTELPFLNESFYHIVFDPPHMKSLGKNSWMAKKYGVLNNTWEEDIRTGFSEAMRVLKTNGTLIFKWNESQIPINKILEVIGEKPVYGHTSGRQSKTIWMCFIKTASEWGDKLEW